MLTSAVFERFRDEARKVVEQAQAEAQELRHGHIGVEHLLLGVLSLPTTEVAAGVLAELGVTADGVRDRLRELVPGGEEPVAGRMPFTPRAKRVLELAMREALGRADTHIGSEHILLGIVRENDSLVVQLLDGCGVTTRRVREALDAALPPPRRDPATRSILRRARRAAVHQLPIEIDVSEEARGLLMSAGARALDDGRTLITIADIEEALRRRGDAEDPPPQSATG